MRSMLTFLLCACCPVAGASELEKGEIGRVTLSSIGVEADGSSTGAHVAQDGRYVAFSSTAANLVPGDGNSATDIFLFDRKKGLLTRESVGALTLNPVLDTVNANGNSHAPSVSKSGRYVAFESDATNLLGGDTNGLRDIFIRDRKKKQTFIASVASDGTKADGASGWARIAASGDVVVFQSVATNLVTNDGNGTFDVFVHVVAKGKTERVSVDKVGGEPNGASFHPDVSGNGRYVVFDSVATDLVDGDQNGKRDVFLRDRKKGKTILVSRSSSGGSANNESWEPRISANGRYVVFESSASNLVSADGNGVADVFLYDRKKDKVSRVSQPKGGGDANAASSRPAVSQSGRYIAFSSDATNLITGDGNGKMDVFLLDRDKKLIKRVSTAGPGGPDGSSHQPSVSGSGRYIAFESHATDLVPADGNGVADMFLVDRKKGKTTRISLSKGLEEGDDESKIGGISKTGRYVAFLSSATNLVTGDSNAFPDAFVRDRKTGITERVSISTASAEANAGSWSIDVSKDGRHVLFYSVANNLIPADANAAADVFLRDRKAGTTTLVSSDSQGNQGNSSSFFGGMSGDARSIVFQSLATNLVANDSNGTQDVFLRDLKTGQTTLVSIGHGGLPADGASLEPRISPNGRYVVFESDATNLVAVDTNGVRDVFIRDLVKATTKLASVSSGNAQGNGDSREASVSANGRFVVFRSTASNLVSDDANLVEDVFVRDLDKKKTFMVSRSTAGLPGNDASNRPHVSNDGRFIAFCSYATNLSPDDTNVFVDVYLHDRKKGKTVLVSRAQGGGSSDGHSTSTRISGDGKFVAFSSSATDLVRADGNASEDGFVQRRK